MVGPTSSIGIVPFGYLEIPPTFGFETGTDTSTANGLPSQVASTLSNLALDQGAPDGVSRSAPPSPTDNLVVLAAASRDPADITIPTIGTDGSSDGGSPTPHADADVLRPAATDHADHDSGRSQGQFTLRRRRRPEARSRHASGVMVSQGAITLPASAGSATTGSTGSSSTGDGTTTADTTAAPAATNGAAPWSKPTVQEAIITVVAARPLVGAALRRHRRVRWL